jgi:hypothetical protein
MKSTRKAPDLISIQWLPSEKRAQGERNLKRLIAAFEQMENLLFNAEMRRLSNAEMRRLFNAEMRSTTQNASMHSDSRSAYLDPEIENQ